MSDPVDIEVRLLLEAIVRAYGHDFRGYALRPIRRQLLRALPRFGCESISQLQHRVLREPEVFTAVLRHLTIRVSELFRDPPYWRVLRETVVPLLRSYAALRIWVAGCAEGEEAYSFAVLLHEEGLLERATIYATDVDPEALRVAALGVYEGERLRRFARNHAAAGGKGDLGTYGAQGWGRLAFHRFLRERILFADHSLSTDAVFAEVQVVSCRNVLIYFDRGLQEHALRLFADALVPGGVLGLGAREGLVLGSETTPFTPLVRAQRLYRRA